MNGLALCAGLGGLELGVRIATRGSHRVVCYVEREAYAAAALVARMEDTALDQAPIWDDLKTFDGREWRGVVDCITSGLPCQPYSLAGERLGHADERALWPEFIRIVRECEPSIVFLENVPAFLKHFGPVWRDLRELGFQCAPPLFQTASEHGGPHERRRLFVLAAHTDRARVWLESWRSGRKSRPNETIPRVASDQAPYAARASASSARAELRWGHGAGRRSQSLAHTDSHGLAIEWSGWRMASSAWRTGWTERSSGYARRPTVSDAPVEKRAFVTDWAEAEIRIMRCGPAYKMEIRARDDIGCLVHYSVPLDEDEAGDLRSIWMEV